MTKMKKLRNGIGYVLAGLCLFFGCESSTIFTETIDLDRDASKERVIIRTYKDGNCVMKINELNRVKPKGGFLESVSLVYDNVFFRKGSYGFELPIYPQSIGFRDTNEDGYLDIVFHSEKGKNLESYVIEQTGNGDFKQPRKINMQSYIELDKAKDLSQRSLDFASRGNYQGAIHLTEQALDFLHSENPVHHKTLFNLYKDLFRFYEKIGNKEKLEKIENKKLNLMFFKGRF